MASEKIGFYGGFECINDSGVAAALFGAAKAWCKSRGLTKLRGPATLAVEAIEGTDEAIRRAGRLGGPGAVVVKRAKPGQDQRFDLPAAGPVTLEVMREAQAKVLAVEAGKTVLLDADLLFKWAHTLGICVVGVRVE